MISIFNNPDYFDSNEEYYNHLNLIDVEYINKNPPIFRNNMNEEQLPQNMKDIEIANFKDENYFNSINDDNERYFTKTKNNTLETTNPNKNLIFQSM